MFFILIVKSLHKIISRATLFLLLLLVSDFTFAGCPGCCSSHGGIANICSASGRIYCADGTVSPSCYCSTCGVAASLRTQYIYSGTSPSLVVGNMSAITASASSGLPITLRSTTPSICSVR